MIQPLLIVTIRDVPAIQNMNGIFIDHQIQSHFAVSNASCGTNNVFRIDGIGGSNSKFGVDLYAVVVIGAVGPFSSDIRECKYS